MDVVQRVREIYQETQNIQETWKRATAEGLKGVRSGKPIAYSSIVHIVESRAGRRKAKKTRTSYATIAKGQADVVESVKKILALDIDAEERIALVQLILERL